MKKVILRDTRPGPNSIPTKYEVMDFIDEGEYAECAQVANRQGHGQYVDNLYVLKEFCEENRIVDPAEIQRVIDQAIIDTEG